MARPRGSGFTCPNSGKTFRDKSQCDRYNLNRGREWDEKAQWYRNTTYEEDMDLFEEEETKRTKSGISGMINSSVTIAILITFL
eukprot:TRINITY_DN280_c0_g1_i2.p1 TRINITY_DN280_c0_g1~~TRINITY_DN280_c0_g1_i2.p1  ORF type:complete len:84 (-),score=2.27 TRINITY_DN280_c0_g1_i2:339-590(-)